MPSYLICYDINKEGAAYAAANKLLTDRIKAAFGTYWHHLDSTWIVVTNRSAVSIRDDLERFLDDNDELLVIKSGVESAWHGINKKGHDWLHKYL